MSSYSELGACGGVDPALLGPQADDILGEKKDLLQEKWLSRGGGGEHKGRKTKK